MCDFSLEMKGTKVIKTFREKKYFIIFNFKIDIFSNFSGTKRTIKILAINKLQSSISGTIPTNAEQIKSLL